MSDIPNYEIEKWEAASGSITITTPEDYKRAGEILIRIATITKKLIEGDTDSGWVGWKELVSSAFKTYKKVSDSRTKHMARWLAVREAYEKAMGKYRENTEIKTARLTSAMERTALKMRADIEAKAAAEMRAGQMAKAKETMAQLDMIPLKPTPIAPDHRLPGIAQGEEYEVTITNLMDLVKAVADGRVPLTGIVQQKEYPLFEVRTSVIRAARSSMGEAFNWPGVEIKAKTSYRPRAESA